MKKILFCLMLCSILGQSSFAQRFGKLLKEAPGVVSYTFRDAFSQDVPGTLDMIKAMGITNIEFSSLFKLSAERMRTLLDERGMRCSTYGVGYDAMNNTENVIKTAKILGAEFVRIPSIPHKDAIDSNIIKKAVVDFNVFGKKLKESGLSFCYHNHGPEFVPGGAFFKESLFDYLVQKTDPKYVSFEMDVLWVLVPGYNPIEYLNKYPKRFKLMHLKDRPKSGGENVALGTGQIDMNDLLKTAKKTAVRYFYIEDESKGVKQQVPKSLAHLKSL
ncbi:sugar phosphate isomerase/epimerase family protein [Pedobacter hiemivivus]|uniref:Sugar phosphate isomerase/epimerase n=1 Tax=Pedobacter hiemivivus TaxID=2530454 RepID=A0A4R0NGK3_9SPHI|nr:TIM barrel protein [Pedobacter hiemivivus]TCC99575.1 sugar phosphate isomerase/epimerase [Pedobacter hiemivivus]